MSLFLFLQAAARPGWYDWPWGAAAAIAIVVGLAIWLLRMALRDYFASPGQVKDLEVRLVKDRDALFAALEADIEKLGEELKQYEGRCDARTTRFEEKLEKTYVTRAMLDGWGERVKAVDDRVSATISLVTSARDRADQAHEISRDLKKDLENFMGRMEEKLGPVTEFQRELRAMSAELGNLTRLLATLQAGLSAARPTP